MNWFKKIWNAWFGVDSLTSTAIQYTEPAPSPLSASYDDNPPLPAVADAFDGVVRGAGYYFNPFTGELTYCIREDLDTETPESFFLVPPELVAAADTKLGVDIRGYIRFTDHRSALGHWASELRKREGIVYDRKTIETQNKVIAKLVKAQKGKK